MSLRDTCTTFVSTSARESVSSNEFAKICFVSNKAEEMKQEKVILRSTDVLVVIHPNYLTQAEAYCFSVNHAGKDFVRNNLKVKGRKFGTDGTNV